MRIGACNLPRKNICAEIEWIGKHGFDYVDLLFGEEGVVPGKKYLANISRQLRKYNLGAVGHTVWYLPTGSALPGIRKAAVDECIKYFPAFSAVGAEKITIHANWPGQIFTDEEGLEFQAESLKTLVAVAAKHGLKIMYEHIPTKQDTLKNLGKILKKVPGLYFNLDIGHASVFGRKPEDFIKTFHGKLEHVHLHESKNNLDLHLPIGKGDTNTKKAIQVLKKYYNGTITIEVITKDRKDVLRGRDTLKKLWNR
ncbi:MAG: hypothetical protein A2231_12460 [Candidatus Firestonebacteria bacterium RIFOXYA2_FULL_40_8]|nr:MAG: hypothetical protein A2231_12460 [Candidatus Firestonebacteria bacterium RIFOXYA2_FULL_40_8]